MQIRPHTDDLREGLIDDWHSDLMTLFDFHGTNKEKAHRHFISKVRSSRQLAGGSRLSMSSCVGNCYPTMNGPAIASTSSLVNPGSSAAGNGTWMAVMSLR